MLRSENPEVWERMDDQCEEDVAQASLTHVHKETKLVHPAVRALCLLAASSATECVFSLGGVMTPYHVEACLTTYCHDLYIEVQQVTAAITLSTDDY